MTFCPFRRIIFNVRHFMLMMLVVWHFHTFTKLFHKYELLWLSEQLDYEFLEMPGPEGFLLAAPLRPGM